MKQSIVTLFALVAFVISPSLLQAQEDVADWGKEDAYLLRQAKYMYELVDEALDEYPPVVGAPTSLGALQPRCYVARDEVRQYRSLQGLCRFAHQQGDRGYARAREEGNEGL